MGKQNWELRSDMGSRAGRDRLTPAQKIIPVQMLLLCKYGHHNQRVQVNPLAEHPEIVTAQHVHMEEVQHLAANLQREKSERMK